MNFKYINTIVNRIGKGQLRKVKCVYSRLKSLSKSARNFKIMLTCKLHMHYASSIIGIEGIVCSIFQETQKPFAIGAPTLFASKR